MELLASHHRGHSSGSSSCLLVPGYRNTTYVNQHLLPIQRGPLGVGGLDRAVTMRTRDGAVSMLEDKLEAVAYALDLLGLLVFPHLGLAQAQMP